jgi:hypothetical protein
MAEINVANPLDRLGQMGNQQLIDMLTEAEILD